MLPVSSFHKNTRTETCAPFINCVIDDSLLKTMSDIDQALAHAMTERRAIEAGLY